MVHMDKCSVFVRWSIFILNCLVWVGGAVMLGVGIWVTTQKTEFKHLAGNMYVTIGYIALSSLVFIIGFIGACGILLLKKTLLRVYFALMLLLLLMELGVAIYLYIEKDKISNHINTNWNQTTDEDRIFIQKKFGCCGLKPLIPEHKSSSDKSCFVDNDPTKERLKDCYTQLKDWINANYIILATCSAIVAALQLLILGGTCRLISEIESGDRFVKRTRVVPFNVQQNAPRLLRVQQANRGPNPGPNPWQPSTATVTATATATATASATATATAAATAASSSKAKHDNATDDSEVGSRRNTARKKWAKVDPKYNPVFSLLD